MHGLNLFYLEWYEYTWPFFEASAVRSLNQFEVLPAPSIFFFLESWTRMVLALYGHFKRAQILESLENG
jgi:hypothetical protein